MTGADEEPDEETEGSEARRLEWTRSLTRRLRAVRLDDWSGRGA